MVVLKQPASMYNMQRFVMEPLWTHERNNAAKQSSEANSTHFQVSFNSAQHAPAQFRAFGISVVKLPESGQ